MREAVTTPAFDPERSSLAGRRSARSGWLRLVSIGLVVAAFATLAPEVGHAGTIVGFSTAPQSPVPDGIEASLDQDLNPGAGTSVPAKSQDLPAPEKQEVPQVDTGWDFAGGGTTSAPAPTGGASAPPALTAATLEMSSSAQVRRIRLQEDLALDSPPPLGLLDPPKA
jgi:hypothetical protein